MAKEGLFNILQHNLDIESLKTLDLFGGTGSISYELASRGAKDCTIVESDPGMFEFIVNTSMALKIEGFKPIRMDVFRFIDHCTDHFDLVFAGPPYALKNISEIPELIFKKQLLKKKGWFILEHEPKNDFKDSPFYKTERTYGTTIFSIFLETRD